MEQLRNKLRNRLSVRDRLVQAAFSEFLGTLILVFLSLGAIAQATLSRKTAGDYDTVLLSQGIAVCVAIFIAGGPSGAHINPAISAAFYVVGRLPLCKLLVYMVAQYLGAFLGAALVFGVYSDAFDAFDGGLRMVGGVNDTANIFATYPKGFLTFGGGMTDQIVGTAVLACAVMAISDPKNMEVPKFLIPPAVGSVVCLINFGFSFNCGAALNPARDFGPRLFTYLAGWGKDVFRYPLDNYYWVPIIGPHIGAIVGALTYLLLIQNHWRNDCLDKEMV